MQTINVFFAYQFQGANFSTIEREQVYTRSLEAINTELQNQNIATELVWEYWNIQSGTLLNEEIFSRMDRCSILVFDISDQNPNVLIELGYGIATVRRQMKKMVVFIHKDASLSTLPSDISGMFVLRVNENNFEQQLRSEIYDRSKEVLKSPELIYSFWDAASTNRFDIVCPVLPDEFRSKFASKLEANYLRYLKFADLDTLFFTKYRLSQLSPKCRFTDYTADEYNTEMKSNCVVIGGPVWNTLARELQRTLPLRFVDGGDGKDDPVEEGIETVACTHDPEFRAGALFSDVSYIARIGRGDGTYFFMVSGCRTFGVLGAAKALLDEAVATDNITWLATKVGMRDFVMVFNSRVVANKVLPVRFNSSPISALYYQVDSGEYVKIDV